MLTDRDSLLRRLHELRSEHRDLDTVILRLSDQGLMDQLQLQRLKKRKPASRVSEDAPLLSGRTSVWRNPTSSREECLS